MISENSLNNLRMPKVKKEGYGYRYTIPHEKIDELFTYLADGDTIKKAAKKAKICFETAKKYFMRGDVKRGIKPLQMRLVAFQEKVSEKTDVILEERRNKMLSMVRSVLSTMEESIQTKPCKCCEGVGTQINSDGIKLICPACHGEGKINSPMIEGSSLREMDRMMRLEVFLLGKTTQKETEGKMLSAEELSNGDGTNV
jgi:hypothetical protein